MADRTALQVPAGWTLVASVQLSDDGGGVLTSEGADPHLVYAVAPALPAGWYRLRIDVEGTLVLPSLYLDTGAGMSEVERQDLDLAEGAGIDSVVRVGGSLRHIRFDPSTLPGSFRIGRIALEPIPAAEAVWRMWRALRDAPGRRDAFRDVSADVRAEYLWPVYRMQDTGGKREAYRRWRAGLVSTGVPAVPADVGCVLTLVLSPEASLAELRRAAELLSGVLPGHVELLVPRAVDIAHPRVRTLDEPLATPLPGLTQARGCYVGWISADERVEPVALTQVLHALTADPGPAMLYTDEDFTDARGEPRLPYFKPAWDPDLQAAHDMVGPSSFYRVDVLQAVASEVRGDGAAWAHLLPLRVAAHAGDASIQHLPLVARHHPGAAGPVHSPLRTRAPSPSTVARALAAWLPNGAVGAMVDGDTPLPRLIYHVPQGTLCEIVIPTRDRVDLLSMCVSSVLALTTGIDYRITIVDNGSVQAETFAYLDGLRDDARVRVVRDEAPFNYSALNNLAVSTSLADVVVLLNNDIEITDGDWLREMAAHACRAGVGAVGAKLLYPDGSLQHAGVVLGVDGVAAHAYTRCPPGHPGQFGRALAPQRMSAVTAACLAVQRTVFDEVGGLDVRLAVAFNDVDLCLRIGRAGYRNLWLPSVSMYHHESASRGHEDSPEKQARFSREVDAMQARWGEILMRDPAYNPNLSLAGRAFSIDPGRHAKPVPRTHIQDVRS